VKNGKNTKTQSKTDWKRIDSLRDEDIDYSNIPRLGPDFFANAILWPGPKKQITLRLDPDVVAFFRKPAKAIRRQSMQSCESMLKAARPGLAKFPRNLFQIWREPTSVGFLSDL
jgi:uncharacterized protein (DUF4415 family)